VVLADFGSYWPRRRRVVGRILEGRRHHTLGRRLISSFAVVILVSAIDAVGVSVPSVSIQSCSGEQRTSLPGFKQSKNGAQQAETIMIGSALPPSGMLPRRLLSVFLAK
jgi:hypothetical protein